LVENVIDFQNVTSRSDVFGKVKFFGWASKAGKR
jgi:hypothetical protein